MKGKDRGRRDGKRNRLSRREQAQLKEKRATRTQVNAYAALLAEKRQQHTSGGDTALKIATSYRTLADITSAL